MREFNRLTPVSVKRLGPGMHPDGGGLYLHVNQAGARSWILRYMLNRRPREMGLGALAVVPLAEARRRAAEYRLLRHDGVDPIEARRRRRQIEATPSFADCASRYIEAHEAGWRNQKHAAQWSATLASYVLPVFGRLPVDQVDTPLVMKALQPIWKATPETASRVRGRIEAIIDWAKAHGYRDGDNPARWRGHLQILLPRPSKVHRIAHHAALPYREMAGFLAELRQQPIMAARALEFAIMTAARTSEVLGARWSEINVFATRLWTVPATRMKGGREHRVPLSPQALAILDKLGEGAGEFVFPGSQPGRQLGNMALLKVLQRLGRGDLTTHGFRSSFRDWAAEVTNFPAEVAEMALAHVVGDKVEAAYRRGDLFEKRRELMEAWAAYCGA